MHYLLLQGYAKRFLFQSIFLHLKLHDFFFFSLILCPFLSRSFVEIISVLSYSVENYCCWGVPKMLVVTAIFLNGWFLRDQKEREVFLGTFSFQGERSIIQDKSRFLSRSGVTRASLTHMLTRPLFTYGMGRKVLPIGTTFNIWNQII